MLSLIVLQGPGKGHVFRLAGDKPTVIGRQSDDLRLLDRNISRRHAEINFENGTWVLRDLGSRNGTLINGERVTGLAELEEGDQLKFGQFVLVVGQLSEAPPSLDDTRLVDAEEMDHVGLSPVMPQGEDASHDEDDILRVESVAHEDRPVEPVQEEEPAAGEMAHASMFDLPEEMFQMEDEDDEFVLDSAEPTEHETPSGLLATTQEALDDEANESEELEAQVQATEEPQKIEEPEEVSQVEEPEQSLSEAPANLIDSVMVNPFEAFDKLYEEALQDEDFTSEGDVEVSDETDGEEPVSFLDQENAADIEIEAMVSQVQADESKPEQVDEVDEPEPESESQIDSSLEVEPIAASADLVPTDSQANTVEDENASFAEEDVPASETVSSAEPADTRPAEADDDIVVPRRMDDPSKSRLIWPMAVAVLLLSLGGGTMWYVAGSHTPRKASAQDAADDPALASAATPIVPEPVEKSETKIENDVAVAARDPLMQSPLEEGPALLGQQALAQSVAHEQPVLPSKPVKIQVPEPVAAIEVEPVEVAIAHVPEPEIIAPEPVAVPVEVEAQTSEVVTAPVPEPVVEPAPVLEPLDENHVVYLVDASGSLVDTFPLLLDWLDDEVRTLKSPTQFTVVFFRAGEAVEVPPAGLKDAGDVQVKRAVLKWINWEQGHIFPSGRSDPRVALDLALTYRAGHVCVLSDGNVADRLSDEQIADYLAGFRTAVGDDVLRIRNVQFFYQKVHGLLAHLVRQYQGESEFVLPDRPDAGSVLAPLDSLTGASE